VVDAVSGAYHYVICRVLKVSQATQVDLADVYRVRLEELLEYHPVMCMLPHRNADPQWFQSTTNGRVSEDVIRRCGLDEPMHAKKNNLQSACVP
jgi:hypothetical protein